MKEAIVLPDDGLEIIQSLINKFNPAKSILSSVINHNPVIEELLAATTKFHKLSHLTIIYPVRFTTSINYNDTQCENYKKRNKSPKAIN